MAELASTAVDAVGVAAVPACPANGAGTALTPLAASTAGGRRPRVGTEDHLTRVPASATCSAAASRPALTADAAPAAPGYRIPGTKSIGLLDESGPSWATGTTLSFLAATVAAVAPAAAFNLRRLLQNPILDDGLGDSAGAAIPAKLSVAA
ncbi:MAG: hypothetical protein KDB71_10945 [Mycobacterium sp.]|nr:hypothetical protein [Mycobacterium sp.]